MLFMSFYLGKTFNNKNAKLSKLILDKQKEMSVVKNRLNKFTKIIKTAETTIKLFKYLTITYFIFGFINSYLIIFNQNIIFSRETAYFLSTEAIIYILCKLLIYISLKRLTYHENMLSIE